MNREKLAAFVTKAASFGCAKTVTLMWLAEDCKSFFQKVSRRREPACGGVPKQKRLRYNQRIAEKWALQSA
jgi:hypothetical protein